MEARNLRQSDLAEAQALIGRDALVNLPLATRLDSWPMAGKLLVYPSEGQLTAVSGGPPGIIMSEASAEAGRAFALGFADTSLLHSITGPNAAVEAAWEVLGPRFGNGAAMWRDEVVMATSSRAPTEIIRASGLRRTTTGEIDSLMPAARSVFRDTNGVLPERWGMDRSFRQSMISLARRGLSFAIFDEEGPTFKAEINLIKDELLQIKGVWVRPELRGQGHGRSGMAALLDIALDSIAGTATLRVDAANAPALAVYRRVGFKPVGQARSVLPPPR